jgi:signal transduction histidine kinase
MVDDTGNELKPAAKDGSKQVNIKRYTILLVALWTVLAGALTLYQLNNLHNITLDIAANEAKTNFKKDQSFRVWGASHGGVYVPIDENTPPNKYLTNVEERDIETPSGKKLTLMNPAYMVRQIKDVFSDLYGVAGHLTSLKLLNPDNKPDEWEREALLSFQEGMKERLDFVDIDGKPHVRYMGRLLIEEYCLKCHAVQGYKVGDVRGGISVSIPLAPYIKEEKRQAHIYELSFGIIWALGIIGIVFGSGRLRRRVHERDVAYVELERYKIQLEILVKKRTQELEDANISLEGKIGEVQQANEELKRFTHIISHDLKNPLTSISGMAELMLMDYSDKLDEKSLHFLERIKANTKFMNEFLKDLLEFSRVGRMEEEKEMVNLNAVILQIMQEKQKKIKEDKVKVDFNNDLPEIYFVKKRIYQVLVNLFGNALKFVREGVTPEIRIGCEETEGEHIVYVKDNGIGIDKGNLDKVFDMFTRLKDVEVEGTGIGLAIVKKIVEENNARIWVESEKGKGTTFYVAFKK